MPSMFDELLHLELPVSRNSIIGILIPNILLHLNIFVYRCKYVCVHMCVVYMHVCVSVQVYVHMCACDARV